MRKRKKSPSAKRGKPRKKAAAKPAEGQEEKETEAEWEFLEERFSGMSVDFNDLAKLIPPK